MIAFNFEYLVLVAFTKLYVPNSIKLLTIVIK